MTATSLPAWEFTDASAGERHEAMAKLLASTGKYRVLRRFEPQRIYNEVTASRKDDLLRAAFVDAETTGLEHDCSMIELGIVVFTFDRQGVIYEVERVLTAMEDPGFPIPAEITEITGIRTEDVAGRKFDDEEVKAAIAGVNIVIAYHAEFDRPVFERRFPCFIERHWACAMEEVPWVKFGARGRKHDYLAGEVLGLFHDAHRAIDDCLMGVHLLATPRRSIRIHGIQQDEGGAPTMVECTVDLSPFHYLVESAATRRYRLWAFDSPYPKKDLLKARKFRWSNGQDGRRKGWWKDVEKSDIDAETAWLRNEVYQAPRANIHVAKVTSRDRYSVRA